jgi:uncharacterized membrane-anchored protein
LSRTNKTLRYGTLFAEPGTSSQFLNAHAMVLGRYGHVDMTAICAPAQSAEVDAALPELVSMVQFTHGNRYAEYIPGVDAVSEGGLSALMGGGAASAGFLVLAMLFFKKGAFLLIVPAIWLKNKLFGKRSPEA